MHVMLTEEVLRLLAGSKKAMTACFARVDGEVGNARVAAEGQPRPLEVAVKDLMESDKNVMLASRAQDVLLCLKQRFPGLSQTTLDASKIQHNKVRKHCCPKPSPLTEVLKLNSLQV